MADNPPVRANRHAVGRRAELVSPACLVSSRSALGISRLADRGCLRENTLVDRAGLANQTRPLEIGFRDKSYDFTQWALHAGKILRSAHANIVPARRWRPTTTFGPGVGRAFVGTPAAQVSRTSAVATSYAQIGVGFRSKHCLVWRDSPGKVFLARARWPEPA